MNPKKGILIAFGELFLKSRRVREVFKKKLEKNISLSLKRKCLVFSFFSFHESIFLETAEVKIALKILKNVFGVSWFAESLFFEKAKTKVVSDFVTKNYQKWIEEGKTFAIRLKKAATAEFDMRIRREKIINEIAKGIKRKVDLEKPKREIFVEARKQGWFLYFKKEKGAGGLPVGTGGEVLSLVSGGIDSPVASYLLAKRGAENIWLHFHSFPLVSRTSIEKVKELAKVFLNFQPHLKIYFVPFSKIQMEIKTKILPKYRILFYRKVMFKIAQEIAQKENLKAILTGESLGQVSSQTLLNLTIVQGKISLPILRPLLGMDKEEIINLAKKIGTYEISIKPQEDCCTLFAPKHATAAGNLEKIRKLEKELKIDKMIKRVIKEIKIEQY